MGEDVRRLLTDYIQQLNGIRMIVTAEVPAVKNAQDFVFVYGVEHVTGSVLLYGIFGVIILAAVMSTTDRLASKIFRTGSSCKWALPLPVSAVSWKRDTRPPPSSFAKRSAR